MLFLGKKHNSHRTLVCPREKFMVWFAGVTPEKKPINTKKSDRTPPHLNCNHSVDVSRLSREDVPSVPRTFCPIYVELHVSQVGTSRGFVPNRPWDTSEAHRSPDSLVCSLFVGFSFSPDRGSSTRQYLRKASKSVVQRTRPTLLSPFVGAAMVGCTQTHPRQSQSSQFFLVFNP